MVRPGTLLPALVAVAVLVGPVVGPALGPAAGAAAGPAPAASAAAGTPTGTGSAGTTAVATTEGDAPLALTIGSLTPAALPASGPIRVTGTITNRDDVDWSAVNLYPFLSEAPLATAAELEAASTSDPEAPVGDRLTDRGPYATIDELPAGESTSFSIRVARRDVVVEEEGVYWFGVHASGESPDSPRDSLADGRARTFLPMVDPAPRTRAQRRAGEPREEPVSAALVVPLRRQVRHHADGSVGGAGRWARDLGDDGPLGSLVDLGAAAGDRPITWLVDPAVPDAAQRLAAGNPARSLAATLPPDAADPDLEESADAGASPTGQPSPDTTGSPAPEEGGDGAEDDPAEEPDAAELAAAGAAEAWLGDLRSALAGDAVLSLPYGDLDVAAAARHDPDAYSAARARPGTVLTEWGVASSPAVVPAGGYLDDAGLRLPAPEDTVVVSDRMVAGKAPTVASAAGRRVMVSSSGAAAGGPGPDERLAPVAVRQRLLAEAAVRRLAPDPEPLVAVLPHDWAPSSTAGFFTGLDQPWLDLTSLADATAGPAATVADEDLRYPEEEAAQELDAATFAAAASLRRAGTTLQNVLTRNDRVGDVVAGESFSTLSYADRRRPGAARASAASSRRWIEQRLRSIDVEVPQQVTLSSASGRFSVTLANNLDEPVTVALDTFADEPIEIDVPDTVEVGPRTRRTVLLDARTEQQGVHNVTLVATDLDGTALGSSAQLPIRAAQVSAVIWVIIGAGCTLLLGAAALRLVRRVRRARMIAALEDGGQDGDPDGTDRRDPPGPHLEDAPA